MSDASTLHDRLSSLETAFKWLVGHLGVTRPGAGEGAMSGAANDPMPAETPAPEPPLDVVVVPGAVGGVGATSSAPPDPSAPEA